MEKLLIAYGDVYCLMSSNHPTRYAECPALHKHPVDTIPQQARCLSAENAILWCPIRNTNNIHSPFTV